MGGASSRIPLILTTVIAQCAWGQGVLTFVTRVSGVLDARVTYLDGTPVSTGFTAQLYAGPEATPVSSLAPQYPTTTFWERPASQGYVNAVLVTIPGVPGGAKATVIMRAYNGASWETSTCRGQSEPIVVDVGFQGGPPQHLEGLQPFSVDCIPEPGTLALCGLAAGGWCLMRRMKRPHRFYDLANNLDSVLPQKLGGKLPRERPG